MNRAHGRTEAMNTQWHLGALASMALLIGLTALGGCGGASSVGESSGQCSWPAAYDSPEANAGECTAAAASVVCKGSTGSQICLSDSRTMCPNPDPRFTECANDCHDDEYAIWCRAADFEAPSHCRDIAFFPSGYIAYCCACGS